MITDFCSYHFKEQSDEPEFGQLDWRLRRWLLPELGLFAKANGFSVLTITSVVSGSHTSATHREHRAVDVRLSPLGLANLEMWAEWINSCFQFAPGYRVALVGRTDPSGQHNDHLHLQVPPVHRLDGTISLLTG